MVNELKDGEIESIKRIYKESTPEGNGAINPTSYYDMNNGKIAIVTEAKREENEDCVLQDTFQHNDSKIYIYIAKEKSN